MDNLTFLTKLRKLQPSNAELINFIFQYIDELLRAGHFEVVDKLLEMIDPMKYSVVVNVAILSVTFAAKGKLKNRTFFYHQVKGVNELMLRGLE